ncbi:MAG: MarR family transcriptional regulator [Pseudomonadota bacterium]|nr:MarR family transcriptional regulator [Pseudomonadota bacterium]
MPVFKPPRLVFLLNRAQRATQRWIEGHPDAWDGVSAAQVGLLFLLTSRDAASIGEIAEQLDVAPAAVTNLSKRMQAAELIDRVADADDGRMTRLCLTPAGAQASAQARAVLSQLNAQLTDGFSQEELNTVARWLTQAAQLPLRQP